MFEEERLGVLSRRGYKEGLYANSEPDLFNSKLAVLVFGFGYYLLTPSERLLPVWI